ncbi:MAG: translocation/assembly module TamB domain-containing protein [Ignavibacteria bacterium]|nr:translocation/assembly module TamB domain-containing protein [Ignavibacteria bacterium]MBP6510254.1 translocation/assembly module TamB domain-containing protein [Candidatus Kapabacteria bacterium]
MTDVPTTSEETAVRRPWWRRAAVFTFRWIYRLTGTAIILAGLIVLIAQTDMARSFMRKQVLDLLNGQLEGKVACDDVHLDIFRGLVLEHPQLYANGTTVLEADRLSVAYDLAALFGRTLAVNRVELIRPRIAVIQSKDSVWNVSRIAKPSADTTTSPPPNLSIRVRGISITEGSVIIDDRTTQRGDGSVFDPLHLSLRAFELRAAVRLALMDRDYTIAINHLSFYDEFIRTIDVREMTMTARITPKSMDLQTLALKLVRTELVLRARIDGHDVLRDGINDSILALHPIVGSIEADRVYGPDVHFVVPDVDILDSYGLKANAVFAGANFNIDDIDLRAGDGHVKGSVHLTALDDPDHLGVDINVHESHARYADVRRRLRFVPLPELTFLGTTTIERVHLRGHPADSLWFEVHGADRPGRVDGEMKLFLATKRLGYEVDMAIKQGDLSVFGDSSVATMLNGRVLLNGRGVTLQDLEGAYQIELDRSIVAHRPVRRARLMLQANGAGELRVDTLFADLTPFRLDSIDEYALTPDDRLVGYSGVIDVADASHPRYNGHLEFSAINLASLLESTSLPTRFTGRVDIDAEGIELDSLIGNVNAEIDEFSLDDRALLPFSVRASITKTGESKKVTIEAPFMSGEVHGAFQPSNLISAFGTAVDNTFDAVKQRIRYFYPSSGYVEHLGSPVKPLEATFNIILRDASPLNVLMDSVTLSASARVRGRIMCSVDSMFLDVDTLDVEDLIIQTDSTRVVSDKVHLSTTTRLADVATSPRLIELTVKGRIDSMLTVNSIRIKKPIIDMSARGDSIRLRGRAEVNEITAGVGLYGQFYADSANLTVDSLHAIVDAARGLEWRSLHASGITLHEGNFRVSDLAVQRQDAEVVVANGRFSLERFENLTVVVQNFNLASIPRFVDLSDGHPVRLVDGMVRELTARINGPWEAPVMDLEIDAIGVRYNGELIGTLATALHHENRDVTGFLTISNPALKTETKTLDLVVKHLPLDLGLRDVKERLVDQRPIDIEMRANKLALATIEPFLPAIERLQGVADGIITVKGTTPDKIDLGGNARFKNASFLSSATNIIYNADGVLHLEGSNLHLDTVIVRNLDRDRKNGIAYAKGLVVFNGLAVESLDFTLRSPGVMVMNKASQARSPKIFGDIIIATGKKPIHFYGKLDAPVLEGDINVLYTDIIFPQERSSTRQRYTAFEYNRATDTNKRFNSVLDQARKERIASDSSLDKSGRHPVADAIENIVKSTTASFVDILRYDLDIYLKGRTLMTMVFGMFEILIADLEQVDQKIPLNFTGRFVDGSTNLRGKVRVKDGTSTYKFYKPFVASGTLDFTSGGMTDPTLDLKAVYKDRRTLESGKTEDFRVEIAITGTKQKPIARWSVYRSDRKQEGDSAKITGDALMLILVGKTQDELTSSGQGNLVGEVNAAFSAAATSALGDLLSGIGGIVQSTQIDIGSDISQSRLTVSGQLFSDVSYRLTGQISDFAGNSTITISLPFTVLSDADAMRYFMLDVSRSVNTTGNITRYQRLWEVKLGARLP